jgi:hypothetical protein
VEVVASDLADTAGGEGGISGKGMDFLLPEADTTMMPEETPRWGVVMAQQSQFEGEWISVMTINRC